VPGVTRITVSGNETISQDRAPTTAGSWSAKLKSGTPTYRLDGGARRTDASTNLISAGTCSQEQ
jgi:hypothetical protein